MKAGRPASTGSPDDTAEISAGSARARYSRRGGADPEIRQRSDMLDREAAKLKRDTAAGEAGRTSATLVDSVRRRLLGAAAGASVVLVSPKPKGDQHDQQGRDKCTDTTHSLVAVPSAAGLVGGRIRADANGGVRRHRAALGFRAFRFDLLDGLIPVFLLTPIGAAFAFPDLVGALPDAFFPVHAFLLSRLTLALICAQSSAERFVPLDSNGLSRFWNPAHAGGRWHGRCEGEDSLLVRANFLTRVDSAR